MDPVDRINGLLGLVDEKMKAPMQIRYLRAGKAFIRQGPIGFLSMLLVCQPIVFHHGE
jgi:hypothetical protein